MIKMKKTLLFSLVILFSLSFYSVYALEASTESYFDLSGIICVATTSNASWYNSTSSITLGSAMNQCNKYSSSGIPDCCPSGYSCNASGRCINSSEKHTCKDYDNKYECEHDLLSVSMNTIKNPSICGVSGIYNDGSKKCVDYTTCACEWKSNKCTNYFNVSTNCDDGSKTGKGYCSWTPGTYQDNCNNSINTIYFKSVATWIGVIDSYYYPNCIDFEETYPCGNVVKLGFFNFTNLIIAVLALFLVYYFYITTKKDFKIKNNKSNKKKTR